MGVAKREATRLPTWASNVRTTINGAGQDSTADTVAWLQMHDDLTLANLYLIGEPEDPRAFWLTDWDGPLSWPCWGVFQPAVISRGAIESKIGLEVSSLEITWSPGPFPLGLTIDTASPHQLQKLGWFDNKIVRVWTAYMPTPGDAFTLGCSEAFGGHIGPSTVERGAVKLTVLSFLDVVSQNVPTNLIELTDTLAGYTGGKVQGHFTLLAGSSPTMLISRETLPSSGYVYDTNALRDAYVVFDSGPGSTLGGQYRAIQSNNLVIIDGVHYNQIILYYPLPWAPALSDTFFVAKGTSTGQMFPYVPDPSMAL